MYKLLNSEKFKVDLNKEKSVLCVEVSDNKINKKGKFNLIHTFHSESRSEMRKIGDDLIIETIIYGNLITKQGYDFYILTRKMCKTYGLKDIKNNSLVVVLKDDRIITCYFSKNGPKHINKKQKNLC
jgi:ABC-type xylose transport system substrate-binding protein